MRDSLFDLAMNRARAYLLQRGWSDDEKVLEQRLHAWYLKTRFAYRIPLASIVNKLPSYPQDGKRYLWQGGISGNWSLAENIEERKSKS